ncbi:MAG: hypothetical protein QM680_01675 [Luteolibacter sp.]
MTNQFRISRMDRFFKFLLVCSNLLLAGAFCYHWFRPASPLPVQVQAHLPAISRAEEKPPPPPPHVVVEMKPVAQGLVSLENELHQLRADIQKLNLTALQFAYIGRELDSLGASGQQAADRLREARMIPQKDLTPEGIKAISRITELQKQIDSRSEERRKLLGDLVRKLEQAYVPASAPAASSAPRPPEAPSKK